jgi:hypothetical protein
MCAYVLKYLRVESNDEYNSVTTNLYLTFSLQATIDGLSVRLS